VVAALGAADLGGTLNGLFVRRPFGSLGLDLTNVAWVVGSGVASIVVGLLVRPLAGEPVAAAIGAVVYVVTVISGPARDVLRSLLRPVTPVGGP
jgi:uncharacterized membrane protein HdeD (DUF308 family)